LRVVMADKLWSRRHEFIYAAVTIWLVLSVVGAYDAQTGFTSLLVFGDRFAPQRLVRLRDLPLFTYKSSNGYDGQFYAQIAVAGNPFDRELGTALDSSAYRARRVLLPLLAHLAGLGHPAWVLTAYALSNVLCWLILAWVVARWWFPPVSVHNLVRWLGTMLGAGMLVSVTRSLTDGPALLFIATGVRCLETNRRWLAAVVLGAAGLVRETSVIAATSFLPPLEGGSRRAWRRALLAASVCALPTALWIAVLSATSRTITTGALGPPALGILEECHRIFAMLRAGELLRAKDDVYVVVAVAVQVGFLLARPRPTSAWWRVGAGFAVLGFFLGWGFWEDALCGVPRTLLPLTLAFNVLVPRTRAGLPLLLAGNLTVLSASSVLSVVPRAETTFVEGITVDYASGWHDPEHSWWRSWRWASGSAVLKLHSPGAASVWVNIDFELLSQTDRTVSMHVGTSRHDFQVGARHGLRATFGPFELTPGDNAIACDTTEAPWIEPGPSGRPLAFSLQNLRLRTAPPPVVP
jgi:hypothetical protein